MSVRSKLGWGATAAALALVLGATILSPLVAGAQETSTTTVPDADYPHPGREEAVRAALEDLVEAGTITAAQADAVAEHLAAIEHRPHFVRRGPVLAALHEAAEAIGIDVVDLAGAMRDGQSIAEVATAHGVDPTVVIDALVAAHQAWLDELVAGGRLTAEEAAERAEAAIERITAFVNGEFEWRPGFMVQPPTGNPGA